LSLKLFIVKIRLYRSRYILQCDICKYFLSIDLEIFKTILHKKICCLSTLWLIDQIIDNSNEQDPSIEDFPGDILLTPLNRTRRLPIGNLWNVNYLTGRDNYRILITLSTTTNLRC